MKGQENIEIWDKRYQKDPNIVSRKIANEFILVPIRHNVGDLESIYTLNEVAAWMWELIDGKRTISGIKGEIVREFEVNSKEAEKDIKEFLDQLKDIGSILLKDG